MSSSNSSAGLGWTDIMMMATALESLHTCRVTIAITPRGAGRNGGMNIDVSAAFDVLEGSDLPRIVSVSAEWPSGKARSEVGLVYNLLWQLDYAIGKAYEQMTLSGV